MQRWWDGNGWTEHRQPSEPLVPPNAARPIDPARPTPNNRLLGRNALIIVTLLLVASVAVAGYLLANRGPSERQLSADALAKQEARTAQIAMETYAVENGGSYTGATLQDLRQREPSLSDEVKLEFAVATAYALTVESQDGDNTFSVEDTNGSIRFPCESAGEGSCPSSGQWDDDV